MNKRAVAGAEAPSDSCNTCCGSSTTLDNEAEPSTPCSLTSVSHNVLHSILQAYGLPKDYVCFLADLHRGNGFTV